MKGLRFLGFLAVLFLGVGCASVTQRQSAAISKGIYGEHAAIEAGRFDLALRYDKNLTKLVAPPKKAPVVHSFTTDGKTYAVLPPSLQNVPTVAAGSTLFNTALGRDKTLQRDLGADAGALDSFSKETNSIVRAKDAESAKYEKEHHSWLGGILGWVLKLSIPLLIIGAVCLCIFCPVCIPFLIASVRFAIHLVGSFVRTLGRIIGEIETALEKKSPPSG